MSFFVYRKENCVLIKKKHSAKIRMLILWFYIEKRFREYMEYSFVLKLLFQKHISWKIKIFFILTKYQWEYGRCRRQCYCSTGTFRRKRNEFRRNRSSFYSNGGGKCNVQWNTSCRVWSNQWIDFKSSNAYNVIKIKNILQNTIFIRYHRKENYLWKQKV